MCVQLFPALFPKGIVYLPLECLCFQYSINICSSSIASLFAFGILLLLIVVGLPVSSLLNSLQLIMYLYIFARLIAGLYNIYVHKSSNYKITQLNFLAIFNCFLAIMREYPSIYKGLRV